MYLQLCALYFYACWWQIKFFSLSLSILIILLLFSFLYFYVYLCLRLSSVLNVFIVQQAGINCISKYCNVTSRPNGLMENTSSRCPSRGDEGRYTRSQCVSGRRLPGPMWRACRRSRCRSIRDDAGRDITSRTGSFLVLLVTLSPFSHNSARL